MRVPLWIYIPTVGTAYCQMALGLSKLCNRHSTLIKPITIINNFSFYLMNRSFDLCSPPANTLPRPIRYFSSCKVAAKIQHFVPKKSHISGPRSLCKRCTYDAVFRHLSWWSWRVFRQNYNLVKCVGQEVYFVFYKCLLFSKWILSCNKHEDSLRIKRWV